MNEPPRTSPEAAVAHSSAEALRQQMLRAVHGTLLAALVLGGLAVYGFGETRDAAMAFAAATALTGLWLVRHRLPTSALALTLCLILLALATAFCAKGAGLHDISMLFYPVLLIVAAIVLDRWPFVLVAALAAGSVIFLAGLTEAGIVFDPIAVSGLSANASDPVVVVIILGVGALGLRLLTSALQDSLATAWQRGESLAQLNRALADENANRVRAEAEVRELNATLEARVRERTAQLDQANQELEAFAYSVSHDLRTPLRAIAGRAFVLYEDYQHALPPETLPHLDSIRREAHRMGELIDGLLNLSRLGRHALRRTQVDVRELVDQVLQDLRPALDSRTLITEIGDLPTVSADPVLLRQVFANLLDNALKYSRNNHESRVAIGNHSHPDQPVTFFVRDNGVGFDPAHARKLFGIFERLHDPAQFEGNGVGLALTKRIINRHGGRIWAESRPGDGATFYFTLEPGPEPSADTSATPPDPRENPAP